MPTNLGRQEELIIKRKKNIVETLYLEASELEKKVLEREEKYNVVKEKFAAI